MSSIRVSWLQSRLNDLNHERSKAKADGASDRYIGLVDREKRRVLNYLSRLHGYKQKALADG